MHIGGFLANYIAWKAQTTTTVQRWSWWRWWNDVLFPRLSYYGKEMQQCAEQCCPQTRTVKCTCLVGRQETDLRGSAPDHFDMRVARRWSLGFPAFACCFDAEDQYKCSNAAHEIHILAVLEKFERAIKTKWKFGSLQRLLCSDNSDTNFIANLKQLRHERKHMEQWKLPSHFMEISLM